MCGTLLWISENVRYLVFVQDYIFTFYLVLMLHFSVVCIHAYHPAIKVIFQWFFLSSLCFIFVFAVGMDCVTAFNFQEKG